MALSLKGNRIDTEFEY
jgi:hypothetical protein